MLLGGFLRKVCAERGKAIRRLQYDFKRETTVQGFGWPKIRNWSN